MKKKLLIILIAIILIALVIVGIITVNKKDDNNSYTVKVSLVDEKSPDRTLTVYKDNKKVEFKEIRYIDDILLCKSDNPTVYYGDIENESELKIVLNDNKVVIAKLLKEK